MYLSSLIRSVIALHNLINNKLSNKEAERAVADDADKDKHKVRSNTTDRQPLVQHATCTISRLLWRMAERSKDGCARTALLRWRQIRHCGRCRLSAGGEFGALFDAGEERGR